MGATLFQESINIILLLPQTNFKGILFQMFIDHLQSHLKPVTSGGKLMLKQFLYI